VNRKVKGVFKRVAYELQTLEFADAKTGKVVDTIRTTRDHPFFVNGKGWVAARYLGIGTSIVTRAGPALVAKFNRRTGGCKDVAVYTIQAIEADSGTTGRC
jgi:hypothetical protein